MDGIRDRFSNRQMVENKTPNTKPDDAAEEVLKQSEVKETNKLHAKSEYEKCQSSGVCTYSPEILPTNEPQATWKNVYAILKDKKRRDLLGNLKQETKDALTTEFPKLSPEDKVKILYNLVLDREVDAAFLKGFADQVEASQVEKGDDLFEMMFFESRMQASETTWPRIFQFIAKESNFNQQELEKLTVVFHELSAQSKSKAISNMIADFSEHYRDMPEPKNLAMAISHLLAETKAPESLEITGNDFDSLERLFWSTPTVLSVEENRSLLVNAFAFLAPKHKESFFYSLGKMVPDLELMKSTYSIIEQTKGMNFDDETAFVRLVDNMEIRHQSLTAHNPSNKTIPLSPPEIDELVFLFEKCDKLQQKQLGARCGWKLKKFVDADGFEKIFGVPPQE